MLMMLARMAETQAQTATKNIPQTKKATREVFLRSGFTMEA
tara:strand:+ start:3076 stop:3198 length:123 start_codon:yes stop_codon:yes gene_type:complete